MLCNISLMHPIVAVDYKAIAKMFLLFIQQLEVKNFV